MLKRSLAILVLGLLAVSARAHAQTLEAQRFRLMVGPCVISSGSGAPSAGTGNTCDSYFNAATGDLWVRIAGVWKKIGDIGSGTPGTVAKWATASTLQDSLIAESGLGAIVSENIGSPGYASQVSGWQITQAGNADVRYLFTGELRAMIFTADQESVLAGSQRVTKSYSTISQQFTCPAYGSSGSLWVFDAKTYGNSPVFQGAAAAGSPLNDSVVIHVLTRTQFGPFTVTDCVGSVTGYADGTGTNDGQQSWSFTRNGSATGGAMTGGTPVAVNQLVQDMGVSGNGYVETSAIDGPNSSYAPYTQVNTWTGSPTNVTTQCRFGNENGITGLTEYGLFCGSLATGAPFIRLTSSSYEIRNLPIDLYDSTSQVLRLDPAGPYLAIGNPMPTTYGGAPGVWMGKDAGTYKFRVGDPGGQYIEWASGTLSVNGVINVTGGNATTKTYVDTSVANNSTTDQAFATNGLNGKINNGGAATDVNANVTTISGGKISTGTLDAGAIIGHTITAAQIQAGTLTSNEIAANTITVGNLLATGMGDNLIKNGSFEGATPAAALAGWVQEGGSVAPTASCCGDDGPGTMYVGVAGSGTIGQAIYYAVPVANGQTYHVTIDFYSGGNAGGLYLRVNQSTATQAYVRYVRTGSATAGPNDVAMTSQFDICGNCALAAGWSRRDFTYTVPGGVDWISLDILNYTCVSGSVCEGIYVDAVQMQRQIGPGSIIAGSITADRLVAGSITAGQIAAGTITGTQIAGSTITAGNIAAGTIGAAQIAARSLTADRIGAGQLTSTEIGAHTITADRMTVTSLDGISANLGTINAGTINGITINGSTMHGGSTTIDNNGLTIAAGSGSSNQIKIGGTVMNSSGGTLSISNENIQLGYPVTITANLTVQSFGSVQGDWAVGAGITANNTIQGGSLKQLNWPSGSNYAVHMINGNLYINTSSLRYKERVRPWTSRTDILRAQPILYDYLGPPVGSGQKDLLGFSAENLYTIDPHLVVLDDKGRPSAIRQDALLAHLVVAMQDLERRIAILEKKNTERH